MTEFSQNYLTPILSGVSKEVLKEENNTPEVTVEVLGNARKNLVQIYINESELANRLRELKCQHNNVKVILDYRSPNEIFNENFPNIDHSKSSKENLKRLSKCISFTLFAELVLSLKIPLPGWPIITKKKSAGTIIGNTIILRPDTLIQRLVQESKQDSIHESFTELLAHETRHIVHEKKTLVFGALQRLLIILTCGIGVKYLATSTGISPEDSIKELLAWLNGAFPLSIIPSYYLNINEVLAYSFDEWAKKDTAWKNTVQILLKK